MEGFKTARQHDSYLEGFNNFLLSGAIGEKTVEETVTESDGDTFMKTLEEKGSEQVKPKYKTPEIRVTKTPVKVHKTSTEIRTMKLKTCTQLKFYGSLLKNIFSGRVDLSETGGSKLQMLGLPTKESVAGK